MKKPSGAVDFYFEPADKSWKVKCKSVSADGQTTTFYPFKWNGKPKYETLTTVVIQGTKVVPVGVLKSPSSGYGFTRPALPIHDVFHAKMPKLKRITLHQTQSTQVLSNETIRIKIADFERITRVLTADQKAKKRETETLAGNLMAEHTPSVLVKSLLPFSAGDLSTYLSTKDIDGAKFSASDIMALAKLLEQTNVDFSAVGTKPLVSVGKSLDRILISDLIAKYEKLLARKGDTSKLESDWQAFLADNILYLRLGYVEKVAHLTIPGWTVNIPDFLLIDLHNYVDVVEIKTHLTDVLKFDDSRNNYYWSDELSRAISQAQNYIDAIVENREGLATHLVNHYELDFQPDAIRPRVTILAGSGDRLVGKKTASLKRAERTKMWQDFRRLRTSMDSVDFLLFDELLAGLKNVLSRLAKDDA